MFSQDSHQKPKAELIHERLWEKISFIYLFIYYGDYRWLWLAFDFMKLHIMAVQELEKRKRTEFSLFAICIAIKGW